MKTLRPTEEQLQKMVNRIKGRVHLIEGERPAAKAKYHNKPFYDENGIRWHSMKEYQRFQELRILETAGKISDLRRQVPFDLLPATMKDGKRLRPRRYVADFVYLEDGARVVEDAKGFRDELYKLKKRLMWQLLGIDIFET